MTVFATFIGVPHLPQWAQALALVCTVVGFLFVVVESHIAEGTAKRLVMACGVALALIVIYGSLHASVVQAAVYVGCEKVTWLDWVFWIC